MPDLISVRALSFGATIAGLALAFPAATNAQNVSRGESAFVVQAPAEDTEPQQNAQQVPENDASSKVYFPDAITPESVAVARARAAQQQQVSPAQTGGNAAVQISTGEDTARAVDQLSDGDSTGALAQLSSAQRQVLLDAVEGTDICDRSSDIPALQQLCEGRLETRSAEFAQNTGSASAEDSLLGGGLDSARIATLEAAIARLARSSADSGDFSNQVIASVALGNATLSDSQATSAEGDPASELSNETQAVVQAIVQQLGGN